MLKVRAFCSSSHHFPRAPSKRIHNHPYISIHFLAATEQLLEDKGRQWTPANAGEIVDTLGELDQRGNALHRSEMQ